MKAVVAKKYGNPDVLQLIDIAKPTPKDNEILVKVYATTVTVTDIRFRAFRVPIMFWIPGRLLLGITKPKQAVLGSELAGEIEAIGRNVTRFNVGDAIIALTGHDAGTYAEYRCLPEDGIIAKKPTNLNFEEAATLPIGGLAALSFLRAGDIQSGQTVLINGASGSIGTYAVQLARTFGAEVTGVCSGRNIDLVQSLGADHVIDYTQEDFTKNGKTYDIIFDAVGTRTFAQCRHSLKSNGVFLHTVMVLSGLKAQWYRMTSGTKVVGGTPTKPTNALELLVELVENGTIKPILDRCYPLSQIVEAHRYVDTGRKIGNVAITVADA